MTRSWSRWSAVAGLAAGCAAVAAAAGVWLGERSFERGRAAQRQGRFAAADAAYRDATARGNADAAIERARLNLALGDWDAAERSLDAAMALAPARALPQVLRARLLAERPGDRDAAWARRVLEACGRAVAREPLHADVQRGCGSVALAAASRSEGEIGALREEAVRGYAAALALDPRSARSLFEELLQRGGDPPLAIDVAFRGGDGSIQTLLVDVLAERALWEQSEAACWAAAERRGAVAGFAAAAARALARRSLTREAIAAARRGVAAAPGDPALAALLADLTGRLPGAEGAAAEELYRAALAADPGAAAVRRRFAAFLIARGMHEHAAREAQAVVGADAADAEGWYLLGEALRRRGDAGQAGAAYRAAARLRPANATYRGARERFGGPGND